MKVNKDDKVVDALYEENKMLREKMNKQKDTLYSFIDHTIDGFANDKKDPFSRGVFYMLNIIKDFCERNIWN